MTETNQAAGAAAGDDLACNDRGARLPYAVVIGDNFGDYTDTSENYELGRYRTAGEAIAVCQRRVDDELHHLFAQRSGTPAELWDDYTSFGEDPYVRNEGGERVDFSAWTYAKQRCEVIARAQLELPL